MERITFVTRNLVIKELDHPTSLVDRSIIRSLCNQTQIDAASEIFGIQQFPVYEEPIHRYIQDLVRPGTRCILVANTLRLLDYIQQTNPSSLIFLDKSARNGAYFLRRLHHYLSNSDTISNLTLPPIYYLSIGQKNTAKYTSHTATQLLAEYLENQRLGNRILVVDEVIIRGKNSRQAIKSLSDHLKPRKLLGAIAQFDSTPLWYHQPIGILGVVDHDIATARPAEYNKSLGGFLSQPLPNDPTLRANHNYNRRALDIIARTFVEQVV